MDNKLALVGDKHTRRNFCVVENSILHKEIMRNGIPEFNLIQWCAQYLSPKGVFVDIGSGIGTYSLVLKDICKKVYAFEPNAKLCNCLAVTVGLEGIFNINMFKTALTDDSNKGQEATLVVASENESAATLVPTLFKELGLTEQRSEKVKTQTLDQLKLDEVEFLRIDTMGSEYPIIKGASRTLIENNFPPFIFRVWEDEWYRAEKELVISYVKNLGYRVHPVGGYPGTYLASDHPVRPRKEKPKPESKYNFAALSTKYESKSYDNFTFDEWWELGKYYREKGEFAKAYDCANLGLKLTPGDNDFLFNLEIALTAKHLGKRTEGYNACDKIVFNNKVNWDIRNVCLLEQSAYMKKLAFKKVTALNYKMPRDYIATSSSIIKYGDGYRYNVRGVNYTIGDRGNYIIRDPQEIVRTRNFLLTMNDKFEVLTEAEMLDKSGTILYNCNIQGIEDIRLFHEKYFFATNLEVNAHRKPQMILCTYDETGTISTLKVLTTNGNIDCEKNWLPFFKDDVLHFIYSMDPMRIYQVDLETGTVKLWKTLKHPTLDLDFFRGSASPIPYKGGWLFTIHEVHHAHPRKYFHRFVWCDYEFEQIKFSEIFYFDKIDIEFNLSICESQHSEEGLIVIYSVRDASSMIGILDYVDLEYCLKL